jgi:hypothetical protein
MLSLADHFEPAIVPGDGWGRAPLSEQRRRVEFWSRNYPKIFDRWRDHDGHPIKHTYFYPAEQYDKDILDELSSHCRQGWGEIEIHLHHGMDFPDTPENTRRQLVEFRDLLAGRHSALSFDESSNAPRYAFVHGNFALANSAGGEACGVDSELEILSKTGCYADLTLPAGVSHRAQIGKINSLYECTRSLSEPQAHRVGKDLAVGQTPVTLPLLIQGPLLPDIRLTHAAKQFDIENGALTRNKPPSLRRLGLWKRASIHVHGRPDWLFIKLHCHAMDPVQCDALLGEQMKHFLSELVQNSVARGETIHFVTAREMVNIILAACEGKEGNPGDYRDYRFKLQSDLNGPRKNALLQMARS